MNDLIDYHIPDAISIQVIKTDCKSDCLANNGEDMRRFSVDPQITSLPVLQSLLVRAFNLHCDFSLTYLSRDTFNYCSLESDLDLNSAYLHCSDPYLQIRLNADKSNCLPDWDVITTSEVARSQSNGISIANTLINQVERFMNKALESTRNSRTTESVAFPLNDNQFRNFLDIEGKVRDSRKLRIAVYHRGVDPSLRKVVWKHLLNVYPCGLSAQQRIDYMKLKCETYCQMRNLWQSNKKDPIVAQIINMVHKDVLRTDRCHHYYYGNTDEDNQNVRTLSNVLTTYALNHKIGYCQGMSDLASPLLYAMKDESHAYICFCALMSRLSDNFNANGEVMSRKFAHLAQLLQYYDPEFYSYLRVHDSHELLFCYRWLLLELKREFPFDDTLHMLEVLWSSMPPRDVKTNLHLFDDTFLYIPNKGTETNDTKPTFGPIVTKERAEERSHSTTSAHKSLSARPRSIKFLPQLLSTDSKDIESPDEDECRKVQYRCPQMPLIGRQFSVEYDDSFAESTGSQCKSNNSTENNCKALESESEVQDNRETIFKFRNVHCNGEQDISDSIEHSISSKEWSCPIGLARSLSCESLNGSTKERVESFGSELGSSFSEMNTCSTKSSSCSSLVVLSAESSTLHKSVSLLTPEQLGSNDAFMLFLCLTILLQNRDKIIDNNFDGNDIQMYFDSLVRKNNVFSVLDFARQLFHSYLTHWQHSCQP